MQLPETEGPMRGWLRANAGISAVVGDRVYFSMPEQDSPQLPCIVFFRVGGLPDEFSQDYPDFIFECWDINKNNASNLATVVASEINDSQWKRPVVVNGIEVCMGTVNFGPVPSGGTSRAKRYRVDATFQMRRRVV
jgi:hypothetical protein